MYWEKLGVSNQKYFLKLLYSKPARKTIAHFQSSEGVGLKNIFVRKTNEQKYQKLEISGETYSYESPVCAYDSSVLFFTVFQPLTVGFNWVSIYKVDLVSGDIIEICNLETLKPPKDYKVLSVLEIIGVAKDLEKLMVKVGLEHSMNSGQKEYWLAELCSNRNELSLEVKLEEYAL
jgi:hypothetical protein